MQVRMDVKRHRISRKCLDRFKQTSNIIKLGCFYD